MAPDLGRDKFFAALHEFGVEAEKADWAVVYYAGHGMEIGGVNYLIPVDAQAEGRQRRGNPGGGSGAGDRVRRRRAKSCGS
jgi:hypothetical protein